MCCEVEKIDEKEAEPLSGREVACITDHKGFELVCLNMWDLYKQLTLHTGIFTVTWKK